ncbi:MAG: hypothetical protein K6U14_05235 [Firmicutes bacterium]|nr:hypothetical protein [Alicyclobacillaceae bacterium]MCL6497022.1 hypothetical protein [Bacillota bacterium]
MSHPPLRVYLPRRVRGWELAALARHFHPHLGGQVEVATWEDPPRGPRPSATHHIGRLVAVTASGFVLEVTGRGGSYRWFCGWVDLWTGHVVIRTPALAKAVRAYWKDPKEPPKASPATVGAAQTGREPVPV